MTVNSFFSAQISDKTSVKTNIKNQLIQGEIIMSIHYDVKEHLIINNTAEQDFSLSVYSHRLARIGALMLEDNAGFTKLVVITDGEKREFSGNTIVAFSHFSM